MPSSAVFHTPLATVTWQWGADGLLRGAVSGEVDASNRFEVIREVRDRLHAPGVRVAHVDAARLTFCDARSLVGLAHAARGAKDAGVQVELSGLRPHLARLLDLLEAELPGPGAA